MSTLLRCENNHTFEASFDSQKELIRKLLMQELSCPMCSSAKLKQTTSAGGAFSLTENFSKATAIPPSLRSALERIMRDIRQKLDLKNEEGQSDDEGTP
jgi:hypothetical protein